MYKDERSRKEVLREREREVLREREREVLRERERERGREDIQYRLSEIKN